MNLGPDKTVPLGLILNEFTTNTLKYAVDGLGGLIALPIEPSEQGYSGSTLATTAKVCRRTSARPSPARAN